MSGACRTLLAIALGLFGACATARPQSPDPIPPERGVVPPAPPAPDPTRPDATLRPAPDGSEPLSNDPVVALDLACTTGPITRCAALIGALDRTALPPAAHLRITLEEARIAAWSAVDPNAIGLVLPLSGPYARFGEAAKEAIDLALQAHAPGLRVIVRDSEGDADKARTHANDLVMRERVAALLGPIGQKESAAVAEVARFFDLPHVPLTSELPDALLPEPGAPLADPVLRVRTSAKEVVTAVARHALTELGTQRAALLVPDSDAGREAAAAFRAELERLGGVVVREVAFDPAGKSFDDAVKALVDWDSLPPRQRKRSKIKPDFDTLFIPADALTVRRLVPVLAFFGVEPRTSPGDTSRVQLLGHAGWNHAAVVDRGENLTDNAVFADVFAPDDPDAQAFARRFFLHLDKRPTAFHAESWDATRLLTEALAAARAAPEPPDRAAIRAAFSAPRVIVGATGQVEVIVGGRVAPRAHVMTIDGETIRRRYSEDEERAQRTTTTPPEGTP